MSWHTRFEFRRVVTFSVRRNFEEEFLGDKFEDAICTAFHNPWLKQTG